VTTRRPPCQHYRLDEAAALLAMSRWQVRARIERGQIRGVNVALTPGARPDWRVPEIAVAAYLAEREYTPVRTVRRAS
jgi:hypothetical protein